MANPFREGLAMQEFHGRSLARLDACVLDLIMTTAHIAVMPTKLRVLTVTCKRCGHTWTPRKPVVYVCAACHSPKWDEK